ncbi:GNAT family N-acetyltransferase [Candidatus Halobonum tyrrellensis]|uniref:Acetyltransferase including N-acetylase of ribosomal protein-like protein n=1 Tax=Candidatus Halobonum tyrrellensis G22 TaxID=1324957 RepID=V4HC17_9EURY|nr:GNAT family protein [Candidatus Halobonum tyrrellensis]ESP87593.1 Acetyltransferase including N-acetylase of ribosomal protein-like protein [Candidatus Halobonum tyrrellensis G22]
MFPDTVETDRLRLERADERVSPRELYDAAGRGRSRTVERETAYLPWNPLDTLGDAEERLASFGAKWTSGERAEWAIRPREGEDGAGELAGTAGLICEPEKDLALPAIWLREPFWGRRYSGERADALLDVAFDALGFGVVAVPLHADNRRSYRAVERYVTRHGGRYEGRLRNHAGRYDAPADHHRFSVSRAEWRAADGARSDVRY